MSAKSIIIFDFDGTLADSFDDVIAVFNELAQEYKLSEIKPEDIPKLKNISSRGILKKFKFPAWRLPFLLKKGRRLFNARISSINLFPGIKETLAELKSRGCTLGILSSNSEENIKNFLDRNQANLFDFVYTASNLFGKDKALKKIIRKHQYNAADVIYVGDETRDIEAAKKCGVKVIAVSWGFNSREILEKFNPNYLIDKPEELLKILN
jgi:HAD superfamily hydrolase (TIGR01662 family)